MENLSLGTPVPHQHRKIMHNSILSLCYVISGNHLTSLGLTTFISPSHPLKMLGPNCACPLIALPQLWIPGSPKGRVHLLSWESSTMPELTRANVLCNPQRLSSLYLERKMADRATKWSLVLLQSPAMTFGPWASLFFYFS